MPGDGNLAINAIIYPIFHVLLVVSMRIIHSYPVGCGIRHQACAREAAERRIRPGIARKIGTLSAAVQATSGESIYER